MKKVKIAVVGLGAFGIKHLNGLRNIENAEVTTLVNRNLEVAKEVAKEYNVPNITDSLDEALASSEVDAVILCTPTQIHAQQAIACLKANKHVEVEIPICDVLSDGEDILAAQEGSGLVAMGGHTRRFNPGHQYIHNLVMKDELHIQQMNVQTYFFRRKNINALGKARSWTDSLLWHHAAHTIDLFAYQANSPIVQAHAVEGPIHPELNIPMDMSIQLKAENGAICTLSLSFNNDGPLGTFFRYICDNETYIANYDTLETGKGEEVDLTGVTISNDGIELQDREFVSSILEGREPNASLKQVISCYRVIDQLEKQLAKDNN